MNATVIIPAYDPEENLQRIVDRVWDLGNHVIVVDDGSDISKSDILHRLSEKAIVIHHEKNEGKGAAIKTALKYIKENLWDCNVIGVMDADGQHLPEDMEKLVMKANNRENAMILGVRSIGEDMPLKSRLGNAITRFVFHSLSGVKVSDTQTGLRAFSYKLIDELLQVEGTRYEYETNVLFYCAKTEVPIIEVPIKTIYHDKENSCSHFHAIRDSYRIYRDILKFSLSSFSSFILDYVLFCILTVLFPAGGVGILFANILARMISGGYNYFMNCRFVFQTGTKTQTALQYLTLAICILVMNSIFLQIYAGIFQIPVYMAKVLTEISLFVISFFVQKKIIFRHKVSGRGMIKE